MIQRCGVSKNPRDLFVRCMCPPSLGVTGRRLSRSGSHTRDLDEKWVVYVHVFLCMNANTVIKRHITKAQVRIASSGIAAVPVPLSRLRDISPSISRSKVARGTIHHCEWQTFAYQYASNTSARGSFCSSSFLKSGCIWITNEQNLRVFDRSHSM